MKLLFVTILVILFIGKLLLLVVLFIYLCIYLFIFIFPALRVYVCVLVIFVGAVVMIKVKLQKKIYIDIYNKHMEMFSITAFSICAIDLFCITYQSVLVLFYFIFNLSTVEISTAINAAPQQNDTLGITCNIPKYIYKSCDLCFPYPLSTLLLHVLLPLINLIGFASFHAIYVTPLCFLSYIAVL